jgi:hypothetical protein
MSIFNESQDNESAAHADAAVSAETQMRVKSGANWFYWIAVLSLINSIVLVSGGSWNFIVGLGITQIADAVILTAGGGGRVGELNALVVIVLMFDILVAAVFAGFGYFAGRGSAAMFIVGIVIYVLDGLIYLVFGDYLAAGFHAFALFYIIRGLLAAFEMRKLSHAGPMMRA